VRSDPIITITCDRCQIYEDEVGMTPLAGGGYDERNIDGELRRGGWKKEGDSDICPDCVEVEDAVG
jgi:hypothetical protein